MTSPSGDGAAPSARPSGLAWRLAAGAVLALAAGLSACHRHEAADASPGGAQLKVEMGKSTRLDPDAALRCFVHGQFVGMQTPADCAAKNGVAPGALDVGLDQSGALAAGARDTPLQPLANSEADESDDGEGSDVAQAGPQGMPAGDAAASRDAGASADGGSGEGGIGAVADCLRFGRSGWRDAGRGVTLNACVHAVFDGRCVEPGEAAYGRWGGQTLRLIPGRVGISPDNRNFHPLMGQDPDSCTPEG